MTEFFKRLNSWFISFVLFFVYFVGVGVSRVVYMFNTKKTKKFDSYWLVTDNEKTRDNLSLPY